MKHLWKKYFITTKAVEENRARTESEKMENKMPVVEMEVTGLLVGAARVAAQVLMVIYFGFKSFKVWIIISWWWKLFDWSESYHSPPDLHHLHLQVGSFLAAAGVVGEVACPSDEGENKISFLIFVVLFHLALFFVSSPTLFSAQARRPARRWWWLLAGLSAPPPSSSASPSSSRSTSRGDLSHSHIEIKHPFSHPYHLQDGRPTSSFLLIEDHHLTIWLL